MEVQRILDQIRQFVFQPERTAEEQGSRSFEDVIVRQLQIITDVINGKLGFGLPPGTDDEALKDNIEGVWVRMTIGTGDLGAAYTCTHNLDLPLADGSASSTTLVNVRWIVFQISHDWTGGGANDMIAPPVFRTGTDNVTPDSIQLRVHATAGLTVNDDHPIIVDLFFVPAEQ